MNIPIPNKIEAADWHDLYRATNALQDEIAVLNAMVDDVAKAKLIKETDSDRRKQALSRGVVRSGIDSISKAEHAARTDQKYLDDLKTLDDNLLVAELTLARWTVSHAKIESLRSLVSAAKATIQNT